MNYDNILNYKKTLKNKIFQNNKNSYNNGKRNNFNHFKNKNLDKEFNKDIDKEFDKEYYIKNNIYEESELNYDNEENELNSEEFTYNEHFQNYLIDNKIEENIISVKNPEDNLIEYLNKYLNDKSNITNQEWDDLKNIDNRYKIILKNYFDENFEKINGYYKIEDSLLTVNINNWGIENFYIENINNNTKFYEILYENKNNLYELAICIQIGNWEVFSKMETYINNLNKINLNIYFSIIEKHCTDDNINYLITKYKKCVILKVKNKGMDIGIFLANLHYLKINNLNHYYLIKIHTKTDDNVRNIILNNLIGSHEKLINNLKILSKKENGMISGNNIYVYENDKSTYGNNIYHLIDLSKYLYNQELEYNKLQFCDTTMFITKLDCLKALSIHKIENIYNNLNDHTTFDYVWYCYFYNLNINDKKTMLNHYYEDKENRFTNNLNYEYKTERSNIRDFMIEHAIERLFGYLCLKEGYEIKLSNI